MGQGIESALIVSATATGTTSAVATITGVASQKIHITDITGSSDLATATIQLKDGSTVIWQDTIKNTIAYIKTFGVAIPITVGNNASVTVTGTSACAANIAGYQL